MDAQGAATFTQKGEASVAVSTLRLLTKSLRPMPNTWSGLTDKETRLRRRYLDTNINRDVFDRFARRALFWEAHRHFFNERNFLEINIPVLEHTPGGGDANPFVTHMDALNQDFYLRISQELYLKRLIGGGYERVYEIGPRFRNEGLSDEHLPEHMAMEYYWAYASREEGMAMVEELFAYLLQTVYGGKQQFTMRGYTVDFSQGWDVIDFAEIMSETYGGLDIHDTTLDEVHALLKKHKIAATKTDSIGRSVDKLWKEVRKGIAGPSFLINHPAYLSPLAKASPDNPAVVDRFQLIVAGSELGNGWAELNDPQEQLARFQEQQALRDAGDDEAQWLDIDYVEMLEYGMPPTFGYGHSERVFWFLEDVPAREGVPFPQLRHEIDDTTRKIYDLGEHSTMEHEDRAEIKEFTEAQDFSKKMVVVVDRELEEWQVLNTVGHISAYLGNKMNERFDTGAHFTTQDEVKLPRNSQYPIIVLRAKAGQLAGLLQKVRDAALPHIGFTRDMIETTDDADLADRTKVQKSDEITYLGVGLFGENDAVDALTKRFSLWK